MKAKQYFEKYEKEYCKKVMPELAGYC